MVLEGDCPMLDRLYYAPLRRGLGAFGDLHSAGEQDTGYRKLPDEKRGGCREPRAVPCLNETRAADRPPRALSVPTARKTARRIAGGFVLVGLLKVKPTVMLYLRGGFQGYRTSRKFHQ